MFSCERTVHNHMQAAGLVRNRLRMTSVHFGSNDRSLHMMNTFKKNLAANLACNGTETFKNEQQTQMTQCN